MSIKKMKVFFVAVLLFSTGVQARQYIQCAEKESWVRIVVNLNDHDSTLFQTNGVHLPDEIRVLKKLFFDYKDEKNHYYYTDEGNTFESIRIPNEFIGVASQNFNIWIGRTRNSDNYSRGSSMSCFSSIYNE